MKLDTQQGADMGDFLHNSVGMGNIAKVYFFFASSANIFSRKICLIFEWRSCHGSFMTSTGSKLDLRSIWVDGGPA